MTNEVYLLEVLVGEHQDKVSVLISYEIKCEEKLSERGNCKEDIDTFTMYT